MSHLAHDEIAIRVFGDLALFCPAQFRADPITYPVITPSAAKGIFRSIYWKPEFEWEVREIHILNPIRYANLDGHLAKSHPRVDSAPQTKTLLVDVAYGLIARLVPNPLRAERTAAAYLSEARSRMEQGQSFRQPCFGRREYIAWYELYSPENWKAQDIDLDLGSTLIDLIPDEIGHNPFATTFLPVWAKLAVENGVVSIPESLYAKHRDRLMQKRHELAELAKAKRGGETVSAKMNKPKKLRRVA